MDHISQRQGEVAGEGGVGGSEKSPEGRDDGVAEGRGVELHLEGRDCMHGGGDVSVLVDVLGGGWRAFLTGDGAVWVFAAVVDGLVDCQCCFCQSSPVRVVAAVDVSGAGIED